MAYDPGHDAAVRYPDWRILRRPLHGTCYGFTVHRKKLIVIDRECTRGEWNSTVAHELVHLDRGDRCTLSSRVINERRELATWTEAARRLVDPDDVLRVWHFGMHPVELADALNIDVATLRWWRQSLSSEDVDRLNGRLRERNEGAA